MEELNGMIGYYHRFLLNLAQFQCHIINKLTFSKNTKPELPLEWPVQFSVAQSQRDTGKDNTSYLPKINKTTNASETAFGAARAATV